MLAKAGRIKALACGAGRDCALRSPAFVRVVIDYLRYLSHFRRTIFASGTELLLYNGCVCQECRIKTNFTFR